MADMHPVVLLELDLVNIGKALFTINAPLSPLPCLAHLMTIQDPSTAEDVSVELSIFPLKRRLTA